MGRPSRYQVPIGIATGALAERLLLGAARGRARARRGTDGAGVLYDAVASDAFCERAPPLDRRGGSRSRRDRAGSPASAPSAYEALRGRRRSRRPDQPRIGRAEPHEHRLRPEVPAQALPPSRRRRQSRLRDRPLPHREDNLPPRPEDPRRAGDPAGRGTSRRRWRSCKPWCPNQGQGWEYIVGVLGRFYEQIASEQHRLGRIETPEISPLDLAGTEPPQDVFEVVGAALHSAGVLGTRTGEMHLALASDPADPAFAPEPLTPGDLAATVSRLRDQARQSLGAAAVEARLAERARPSPGRRVLDEAPAIVARMGQISSGAENLIKMRAHGDYHLGQVLWAENDFVILDFEGEPGRSMADRRAKQSPLCDVAGMLRSIEYAVSSSMLIFMSTHNKTLEQLEPWAQIWRIWTSAAFLEGYQRTVAPAGLLPADRDATRQLLDLFTMEKTLFELPNELTYRPEWISIPMTCMLRLVGQS